jgi:hypothetical protein
VRGPVCFGYVEKLSESLSSRYPEVITRLTGSSRSWADLSFQASRSWEGSDVKSKALVARTFQTKNTFPFFSSTLSCPLPSRPALALERLLDLGLGEAIAQLPPEMGPVLVGESVPDPRGAGAWEAVAVATVRMVNLLLMHRWAVAFGKACLRLKGFEAIA